MENNIQNENETEEVFAADSGEKPATRRLTPEQRKQRRRKRRIRLAILWTVFLTAAAVLIFSIVAIIFTALERKAARDQYAQMQALYEGEQSAEPGAADGADAEPTPRPTVDPGLWYAGKARIAEKKINFDALQERNADVCGWITVDGTDIDYPVLRADGAGVLYLSHDIDGRPSEHGTICLDVKCARDFSDRVTLIYGHNMKDGSMFAPLYQYYRDADFFNADHRIHIFIDNVELEYRVFSACEYSYAHPLFFYDMKNDEEFAAYMDCFLNNRDLKARISPVAISPSDHVLTLITSTNVRADQRLFIQAVLVSDAA